MKTIQINTSSFNELSEEAQQVAIENNRNILVHDNWYEFTVDQFKEGKKENGFFVDNIQFSGFYSQGDGAMFEGSFLLNYESELNLILEYVKDKKISNLIKSGKISFEIGFNHYGHYSHEKSYKYDYEIIGADYGSNIYEYLYKLVDSVRQDYESNCKDLYKTLRKEYEYLCSDEQIKEYLIENDYCFDINGKFIEIN